MDMVYFFLLASLLLSYLFIVLKRAKKYKYNTTKDYIYNLNKHKIASIQLNKQSAVTLPKDYAQFDTLFLKIHVAWSIQSYFFKPFIEIQNQKHYFEYGVKGIRYLNISSADIETLHLKLHNLKLTTKNIELFAYKNDIRDSQKILILAPHADDAEIAAFGFYKDMQNVTIVTTTAGESGVCNYCDLYSDDITKQAVKKGELRAFDALSVPLLGNVAVKNSITLGYFGGSLQWMSANRTLEAKSSITGVKDNNLFRKVTHSNIPLEPLVKPTYNVFLKDLEIILKEVKPDIIVTPHPQIDSHSDHKQTTYAIIESLSKIEMKTTLLLYTNHLQLSETYPIGDIYSTITLPPNQKDFYFNSIYSFNLDEDMQKDKFFALEAIHDLRDPLIQISLKRAYKHFSRFLKRKIYGKDKSYYRRAVRANELFFVVNKEMDKLKKDL